MKKSKLVKLSAVMIALMSCYEINAEAVQNDGALLSASAQTSMIQPGMGYSSDSLSPAPAVCFDPLNVIDGGQHSTMHFNQSESSEEIATTLGISGDLSGGYGIFSANDTFKYLRSIQENDLSLSANYYQVVSADKNMYYSYDPENILNATGRNLYNNGINPMFRVFCGDTLISSYNQGALLILSLKINFHNREDKQTFTNNFGTKFGAFFSASSEISSDMRRYGLQGTIEVTGFQLGGDPTQLGKALSTSVAQCDINNVAACQETIAGLVNYASQIFPTQFQKDDTGRIWLSPLVPLGGYTKDYRVSDFGMLLAPSYVTPEVSAARNNLVQQEKENEYYLVRLNSVIKYYSANGLAENYKEQLIALRNIVQNNLNVIANGTGQGGASDCYKFPGRCVAIADSILSHIEKIEPSTVADLLEPIRYTLVMQGAAHDGWVGCTSAEGYFWPDGAQGYFSYYPFPANPWNYMHMKSVSVSYSPSAVNINGNFNFTEAPSDGGSISYYGVNDGSDNYTGTLSYNGKLKKVHLRGSLNCQLVKTINPYYFEPYHSA